MGGAQRSCLRMPTERNTTQSTKHRQGKPYMLNQWKVDPGDRGAKPRMRVRSPHIELPCCLEHSAGPAASLPPPPRVVPQRLPCGNLFGFSLIDFRFYTTSLGQAVQQWAGSRAGEGAAAAGGTRTRSLTTGLLLVSTAPFGGCWLQLRHAASRHLLAAPLAFSGLLRHNRKAFVVAHTTPLASPQLRRKLHRRC